MTFDDFKSLACRNASPSPGTPGEGGGEGLSQTGGHGRFRAGPHPNPNTVQRRLSKNEPPAKMVLVTSAIWQGGYDVRFGHGGRGPEPLVGRGAAVCTEAYHPQAVGDRGAAGRRQVRAAGVQGPARLVRGLVRRGHRAVLRRL